MKIERIYIISGGFAVWGLPDLADLIVVEGELYKGDELVLSLPINSKMCAPNEETDFYTTETVPELATTDVDKAVIRTRNVEAPTLSTLNFLKEDGKVISVELGRQSTTDPTDPTYSLEYVVDLRTALEKAKPIIVGAGILGGLVVIAAIKRRR